MFTDVHCVMSFFSLSLSGLSISCVCLFAYDISIPFISKCVLE